MIDATCNYCKSKLNIVTHHCECGKLAEFECLRCSILALGKAGDSPRCHQCDGPLKERGYAPQGDPLANTGAVVDAAEAIIKLAAKATILRLCECGHYEHDHWETKTGVKGCHKFSCGCRGFKHAPPTR